MRLHALAHPCLSACLHLAALALLCALWCALGRTSALARVDAVRICPRPSALTARSRHRRRFTLYVFRQPASRSAHAYFSVRPRVFSRSRDSLRALVCSPLAPSRLGRLPECFYKCSRLRASRRARALLRLHPFMRSGAPSVAPQPWHGWALRPSARARVPSLLALAIGGDVRFILPACLRAV